MHLDHQDEGPKSGLKRTTKLILAVTLHNIPEGMAVGVVYAGFLSNNTGITSAGALALALGIAIQNFPEGAIVSMPLRAEGMSKSKHSSTESSPAWWSPLPRLLQSWQQALWYRSCPICWPLQQAQ